jgi:hypothetical protein
LKPLSASWNHEQKLTDLAEGIGGARLERATGRPITAATEEGADLMDGADLDPELDETLTTPEAVDRFADLARIARAALEEEPEVISGDRLNTMTGMADFLAFQERPKSRMLADLDRFVGVVIPI